MRLLNWRSVYNDNAVKTRSNMGKYMETEEGLYKTNIQTLFLDFMLKYRGFSVMGEFANRTADAPIAVNTDNSPTEDIVEVGNGLNIQAGYLFPGNYQVVGRFSRVNPDNFVSPVVENQYTFGLSKYIAGHNLKVQTDLSYNNLTLDQNDGWMYRLLLEIHL